MISDTIIISSLFVTLIGFVIYLIVSAYISNKKRKSERRKIKSFSNRVVKKKFQPESSQTDRIERLLEDLEDVTNSVNSVYPNKNENRSTVRPTPPENVEEPGFSGGVRKSITTPAQDHAMFHAPVQQMLWWQQMHSGDLDTKERTNRVENGDYNSTDRQEHKVERDDSSRSSWSSHHDDNNNRNSHSSYDNSSSHDSSSSYDSGSSDSGGGCGGCD